MKKSLFMMLALLTALSMVLSACGATAAPTTAPTEVAAPPTAVPATKVPPTAVPPTAVPTAAPVNIVMWTKEGEADGGLQFVQALADAYSAANPNVTFDITNKDVETLREDFLTAGLAGSLPDLLWTVNDHAGPFTDADLILPVDDQFDLTQYVDSALAAVVLNGKHWGVPISNGNHLMLIYNKNLLATPPANTDELMTVGLEQTHGDQYGLVYNQTEPFWAAPWLGGFGGKVFAEDGKTPTLNTPEMIATLKFMYSLKSPKPIVPAESDYNGADTLFKEGKAAMIINGDWSLGSYMTKTLDIGVARIPMVSSTGLWPAPYTSGVFFMLPSSLGEAGNEAKLAVVKDFITFVTNRENQVEMIKKLNRLPAFKAALDDPSITENPILKGSADQMVVGTPMPVVPEMRCVWDSWKPEMQAVLSGTKSAEDAAAAAQTAAETCIQNLQ
jgi:arabinogalactan oligomer / maltooligosaccharide transport system substrate-binding protein